jgi:hypothetical protein
MDNIDFSKISPREGLDRYFEGYPPEKILTESCVGEAIARTHVVLRTNELELEDIRKSELGQESKGIIAEAQRMINDAKETLLAVKKALDAYVADKAKVPQKEADVFASFIGYVLTVPIPIQFQMGLVRTLAGILK